MIPRILPQARILPANETGGPDGIGACHGDGVLRGLRVVGGTAGCAADLNQQSLRTVAGPRGLSPAGPRQAGSRSIGQVMQRGPPRPRPSSLPTMVTTSMPCLRSMVLVATLRSYPTMTPGATAR